MSRPKDWKQSRTLEITLTNKEKRELEEFVAGLKRYAGLDLLSHEKKEYDLVYKFVATLLYYDRHHPGSNVFIRNCRTAEYMCNVLITAGITEIEPIPGVILCTCTTGACLMGMAESFYSKRGSQKYKFEHLESFRRSFENSVYDGDAEISTVVIPLNIRGNHWGVIVGKRERSSLRLNEKRSVYCGDSLEWQCSHYVVSFFKAVFDHVFPRTKVEWTYFRQNYLLDVLGFSRQQDSHSCGAYVIAGCTNFAASTGNLPTRTFADGYDDNLTNMYRWASARHYVMNIIRASREKRHGEVSEGDVAVFQYQSWKARVTQRRNLNKALELQDARDDRETARDIDVKELVLSGFAQREESRALSASEPQQKPIYEKLKQLQRQRGQWYSPETGRESLSFQGRRVVRFLDSASAVADIVDELITLATRIARDDSDVDEQGMKILDERERAPGMDEIDELRCTEVSDLPFFIYKLSMAGENYGVHRFRLISRSCVRQTTLISARLRCIKHKPPVSCQSSITAKLLVPSSMWSLSYSGSHSHGLESPSHELGVERYNSVVGSIQKRLIQAEKDINVQRFPAAWNTLDQTLISFTSRVNRAEGSLGNSDTNSSKSPEQDEMSREEETTAVPASVPMHSGEMESFEKDKYEGQDVRMNAGLDSTEHGFEDSSGTNCTADPSQNLQDNESSVEPADFVPSGDMQSLFCAAVRSYISTVEENAGGVEVLKEVQFIADCFGYSLFVRDSEYTTPVARRTPTLDDDDADGNCDISSFAGGGAILKKAYLRCSDGKKEPACPFFCTISTSNGVSRRHGVEGVIRVYRCHFRNESHNHEPTLNRMITHLSPKLQKEAIEMKSELHIQLRDIVGLLERKYGISMNTKALRNKLAYNSSIQAPQQHECMLLCKELMRIRDADPENRVYFNVDEQGRMNSASWTYAEWLEDYAKYGIVPIISMDCKAISNRFGFPLLTINGRCNDGRVLSFFMGFVSCETEESFVRILEEFKRAIGVSPSMRAMDQSIACINAAKQVFPLSYIDLDEWHLDQNQARNCPAWCAKIGKKQWAKDLSNELYRLRRSTTEERFVSGRHQLEQKYFYNFQHSPPTWYKFLYQKNYEMVVDYYRNQYVPHRFLFQGSGYTESSNAIYRQHILRRVVPLWKIPSEIYMLTQRQRHVRIEARKKALKPQSFTFRKISNIQLPAPRDVIHNLVREYTPFCLLTFVKKSVEPSTNYAVLEVNVRPVARSEWPYKMFSGNESLQQAIIFTVAYRGANSNATSVVVQHANSSHAHVYLAKLTETITQSENSIVACSCLDHSIHGFPCRHIMRCAVIFPELLVRSPILHEIIGTRIPIENFFQPYWKNSPESLTTEYVTRLRKSVAQSHAATLKRTTSSVPFHVHDREPEQLERNIEAEVQTYLSWADGKALYDNMHRLATFLGPIATKSLKELMQNAIESLSQGQPPDPLSTSTLKFQNGITPILNGTYTSQDNRVQTVRNPNPGLTKNGKRKRACTESFKSKKSKVTPSSAESAELHLQFSPCSTPYSKQIPPSISTPHSTKSFIDDLIERSFRSMSQ